MKLKYLFFVVCVLCIIVNTNAQLAILPFEDHSGFKSKWDLKTDIPNFFRSYLKEKYNIQIASPNLVKGFFKGKGMEIDDYNSLDLWKEISGFYKTRYILIGSIKEFKLSKFNAGLPLIAGYESYSTSQVINFRLYDVNAEKVITSGDLINNLSDRGLGITFAGKPTDRNKEYNSVDDIEFGGEDFSKTLIGESMIKLSVELASQIEPYVHLLKSEKTAEFPGFSGDSISISGKHIYGSIIILDKDGVFIDLGSSDGLVPGEKLLVLYPEFEKIKNRVGGTDAPDKIAGIIEVKEIRSNHFSLCKIHMGEENLQLKYIVQKTIIK